MNNANMTNDNFGFYELTATVPQRPVPDRRQRQPAGDQLLGVNDHDIAVGFYTDGQGNNHGYTYNIRPTVHPVSSRSRRPGPSLTAAAINNNGDIAGFYTDRRHHRRASSSSARDVHRPRLPGRVATQALGVNDHDEVVGAYTVGTGTSATMHGFTWTPGAASSPSTTPRAWAPPRSTA